MNKELDKKIDLALSKKNESINKKSVDKSFLSTLSRVATELVAGLIIGTGLGLLIVNWLETKPLFLIICIAFIFFCFSINLDTLFMLPLIFFVKKYPNSLDGVVGLMPKINILFLDKFF